jgi:uncharacterized membrane protein YagU involved in acid resistance
MSPAYSLAAALFATVILTTTFSTTNGFHWTRLNLPFLLGTMLTPERKRALRSGLWMHLIAGCVFGLIYTGLFCAFRSTALWLGALIGLLHGAVVLTVFLPALPSWHPRMASAEMGSTLVRQLEPPGFLGNHYGSRTPEAVLIAHVLFGVAFAAIFRL